MMCLPAGLGIVGPSGAPTPTYRHFRLKITANDGSASFCGCTEIELHSTIGGADFTAIAGHAISATSEINGDNVATNAFDNNLTSGWLSATAATSSIMYDNNTQVPFAEIVIRGSWNAPSASPKDFTVSVSNLTSPDINDDGDWTTVITVTGETGWTGASDARTFQV